MVTLSLSGIPHIVDAVSTETALDGEARSVAYWSHLCALHLLIITSAALSSGLKTRVPGQHLKSTVLWMYAHRAGPEERIGTVCGPYT